MNTEDSAKSTEADNNNEQHPGSVHPERPPPKEPTEEDRLTLRLRVEAHFQHHTKIKSWRALEERAGWSTGQSSKLHNGTRKWKLHHLKEAAEALDLSEEEAAALVNGTAYNRWLTSEAEKEENPELVALRAALIEVQAALKAEREHSSELRESAEHLQQQLEAAQAECRQLSQQKNDLEVQISRSSGTIDSLRREKDSQVRLATARQKETNSLILTRRKLKEENRFLQAQNGEWQNYANELERENRKLRKQMGVGAAVAGVSLIAALSSNR